MELLGLGVLLVFTLGTIVLWTRGVFARDLTRALKRVNQQEQELQEKADILEQRLAQMERDYQTRLKSAQKEAERLLDEARQQTMNIRTAAIEEAKHRARHLLLEAEQSKTSLRTEVARELNGQVIQRACELLQSLLPSDELASLHRALTAELLGALQHVDLGPARNGVERVEVISARPFTSTESQQLTQWVEASVGAKIPLHVQTDASLVAGCIVRVGSTVVDNSLANRLSHR